MSLKIKRNIPLAPYTTLKIGGIADYFTECKTEEEVIEALLFASEKKMPYYILSGGSNVLVSDAGFRGIIIKIKTLTLRIDGAKVSSEAGVSLPLLAKKTTGHGLSGLEFGIGVPGTVGGAVYGNAGAFGQETKDVVNSVCIARRETDSKIAEFSNEMCEFAYRDSIFKRHKDWIILSAVFTLKKDSKENCEKRMMEMLKNKTTNQPMGELAAGSIFKNPPVTPAWRLIDEAGMRGAYFGNAKVSTQHANYFINTGGATAADFLALIRLIKDKVQEKCGIQLEEEIQFVGF
ncbi:MAG: UDP-N-acetylenolpyruvoylglucosamine reductase [Parcubacteria group bacterium GW2011_GWC2_44_17]|uniref:UDP-N-acetylenolpyruvoylglucosamine reductase n=1 Tax=Candidatus Jacksonbacteria bacterium RIFCSPLOWO2_02_FULL_44_20 TaxID=1798460 RepID=A0A1G2AAD7_9BACT|nr:MAG: UDP-N-acetylenolpyruvoylglucosamine reductase [Parcubacteria group bacterium GW2011_GWC2_44_17]OGY73625.1 MAG: UDP-N-acetylenolpyruvoylglucosamine reductase [Candidatus Jacksonbacteria bacterium RIFCSPLOWO2_02_FULL_44_20]OGY75039.1 MAG: UDP-N-acetylenolpyruvoylglucosamine reductase [Candidatus Jacksonbacteria bacterium RIFCSPLOWO2_12_FULL_44_15b]HCA66683.1 UDP-N-acetylenolpyruvoylglucosamine reductase [Candidatus Jacksonbacteria bacterium]HCE86984.1 UDP-N-acetylenolpyruvoylglucosamine r